MPQINVVFFNAGGTLIQLKNTTIPKLYSQILSKILGKHIPEEVIYRCFHEADQWARSRKVLTLFNDLEQRKYQNVFYSHLGITKRKEINKIEHLVAQDINYDFVLETNAKKVLKQLQKEYKIGLISNWDENLFDILEDLAIVDIFDSITISGDIGYNKPSQEIFKSALSDFPDSKPNSTIYIGDDYYTDIIPAQAMRMHSILFDKGPTGMHGHPFRSEMKCAKINSLDQVYHTISNIL
ncbi:MAG: hypothetical protein EAX86_02730 [Candidatus Heimdallarchaeota archaeon]|nr:hypothetical protein [Candidatus Heimdallarchaeota archaeon]